MSPALLLATALFAAAPSADEQLKMGEMYVAQGNGKRAVPLLEGVLKSEGLEPAKRARAEAALGTALLQDGKAAAAYTHLEAALAIARDDEKTWLLLGMAANDAERFSDEIAAYERGMKALPSSYKLPHHHGMALLEAGQPDAAEKSLRLAVSKKPDHPDLLTDHAFALNTLGRHKDAREAAQRATSLAPENADAYYNLGDAQAGLGKNKEARAAYETALEQDPLHVPALYHLGLLDLEEQQLEAASKRFVTILKVDAEHQRAKERLGVVLERMGKDEPAKRTLLAALKADPDWAQGHAALGDIAERAGDLDEAVKRYREVKRLMPKDKNVAARLAELEEKKKAAKKGAKG